MQDAVSIWVSKFGRLLHFHVVRNRTIVYLVLDRYVSRRYLPHSELMHATHSAFSLKHFVDATAFSLDVCTFRTEEGFLGAYLCPCSQLPGEM